MDASNISKWLFLIGGVIIIIGIIFFICGKIGVPLGKLPGDIHIQKGKVSFYFPIITSILISIFFTIIINIIVRLMRK
jgi:hypothetical protein